MVGPTAQGVQEVLTRFSEKRASFSSLLPSVAGPIIGSTVGALVGDRIGSRLGSRFMLPAQVTGTILGTTAGRALQEKLEGPGAPPPMTKGVPAGAQYGGGGGSGGIPGGAPFAIDPTVATDDIPPWALMGAQILRAQKMGALKDLLSPENKDILLDEIPGYSAVEGWRRGGGAMGALKGTLGLGAGGVAGAGLGLLAGKGIAGMIGGDPRIPLINMPMSHLLASLGGTIGATKGFQYGVGTPH